VLKLFDAAPIGARFCRFHRCRAGPDRSAIPWFAPWTCQLAPMQIPPPNSFAIALRGAVWCIVVDEAIGHPGSAVERPFLGCKAAVQVIASCSLLRRPLRSLIERTQHRFRLVERLQGGLRLPARVRTRRGRLDRSSSQTEHSLSSAAARSSSDSECKSPLIQRQRQEGNHTRTLRLLLAIPILQCCATDPLSRERRAEDSFAWLFGVLTPFQEHLHHTPLLRNAPPNAVNITFGNDLPPASWLQHLP